VRLWDLLEGAREKYQSEEHRKERICQSLLDQSEGTLDQPQGCEDDSSKLALLLGAPWEFIRKSLPTNKRMMILIDVVVDSWCDVW
jgi:hypothetical protein